MALQRPRHPRCQSHQSGQTRLHRSSKCVGSAAPIGVGGDLITTVATALMRTTHATVTGVTVITGDVQRRSKYSASFFLNCCRCQRPIKGRDFQIPPPVGREKVFFSAGRLFGPPPAPTPGLRAERSLTPTRAEQDAPRARFGLDLPIGLPDAQHRRQTYYKWSTYQYSQHARQRFAAYDFCGGYAPPHPRSF